MSEPTEYQEMRVLADYLNLRRLQWFHPPNEGKRSPIAGRLLKLMGLRPGIPDIIIISRPTYWPPGERPVGMVIELKRKKGGVSTEDQNIWIEVFRRNGWIAEICRGADQAIKMVDKWYV